MAATSCGRERSSSPAGSRGGSSRSRGSTASSARGSSTARPAARRRGTHGLDVQIIGAGKLGRPGGDVLLLPCPQRDHPLPRRGAWRRACRSIWSTRSPPGRTSAFCFRTEVRAAHGETSLEAIDVHDATTGETTRLESGGLFVFIGADAETAWLPPEVALDPRGYVLTGSDVVPREAGSSTATLTCSRRASRAFSPAATSATAPSSASRRRSARAACRSPSSTSTCGMPKRGQRTRRRRPRVPNE